MEMRLPEVERIVTETIDGKQVQKQIYADGSYGIRHDYDGAFHPTVERFFPDGKKQTYFYASFEGVFMLEQEKLPDGTYRKWDKSGQIITEKLPDGTYREWYRSGGLRYERLSNGSTVAYDGDGKVVSRGTDKGFVCKKAKERVAKLKEAKLAEFDDKPKVVQKVAGKIASSKAFNDIALKVATRKIKKSRGE